MRQTISVSSITLLTSLGAIDVADLSAKAFASPPRFSATRLDTGDLRVVGLSIADSGHVAAHLRGNINDEAALWDPEGRRVPLTLLPGHTQSAALGITSDGSAVVGWSAPLPGPQADTILPVMMSSDLAVDLGGGRPGAVFGITSSGLTYGALGDQTIEPSIGRNGGPLTPLAPQPSGGPFIVDVTASGRAVINTTVEADTPDGFRYLPLWHDPGTIELFDVPPGFEHFWAADATDSGVVIGRASKTSIFGTSPEEPDRVRGLALVDGVYHELPGLAGRDVFPDAINEAGVIVGSSWIDGEDIISVIWSGYDSQPVSIVDLIADDPGVLHFKPYDINDRGQIVGMAVDGISVFPLILTPIPEPAMIGVVVMLGFGLRRVR